MNDLSEDELDFEPEDELGEQGAAQAKLKKLREQLKEAQQKRDEHLAGWQREKADAVNHRKDTMAEADRRVQRAKEGIIEEIIPVLDSFDLATGNESWENMDESWKSGIDMIRNQLLDVLSRNGVVRYGKVGERFDHNRFEAVQEVDNAPGKSGEVVKILRYGYEMNGKVLRAAQVIVKA